MVILSISGWAIYKNDVLVTDYTLRKKIMSANAHGIIALTGRAHCQRQVAFLKMGLTFISFYHDSIEIILVSY